MVGEVEGFNSCVCVCICVCPPACLPNRLPVPVSVPVSTLTPGMDSIHTASHISSSSPSNQISCPVPSLNNHPAPAASAASAASVHHANHTIPRSNPTAYRLVHTTGPSVLAPLVILDASPWTDASAEGCGVQLLTKICVIGSTNVRPST